MLSPLKPVLNYKNENKVPMNVILIVINYYIESVLCFQLSEFVNLQDLYEILGISRLERAHTKSVPLQVGFGYHVFG